MFTARRQGDRVGLMVFDTRTYKHWPLTDDLKIILRKAKLISKHVGGGTDFEGPEGPIQSAIEHFKDYGKAKTKVLIFVTDGEAPIDDERMEELVSQMKEIGGKIYVLGVGEDWTDPNSSSASQTEPLKKLVSRLGGKCFAVGDAKQMQEALLVVDELEKSRISTEHSTTFRDAYQYFAAAAVVSLALLSLSVLVTREVI
jgi:Ca-activated chloride channel family protein